MLLDRKRLLITGVLTDASLAFGVAKLALEEGAEILLTSFGRQMSITRRTARRLPSPPDVLELDVNNEEHLSALTAELDRRWGGLDGVLHAIGYAPEDCLGGGFVQAPWSSVAIALQTSAYSLAALARATMPVLKAAGGGSIVALDFDATVAWAHYDWMGVAKATLESTMRYLARDLGRDGIRVNCVSAGPQRTMAAKSIPGFAEFGASWRRRAPLGWDETDIEPVAQAVAFLLSDRSRATTAEILHVDGGYHAMGSDLPEG
jgi:meromycolic acid enoyl-[acyl-carrier protein] reductase